VDNAASTFPWLSPSFTSTVPPISTLSGVSAATAVPVDSANAASAVMSVRVTSVPPSSSGYAFNGTAAWAVGLASLKTAARTS
jgi:hypothetical protein